MLAASLLLALAAAAHGKTKPVSNDWPPNVECTLARPAGCVGSSEFIANDPEFGAALAGFIAGARYDGSPLAPQLVDTISQTGPSSERALEDGVVLLSGCNPYNCYNKGAVLVAPGRILGAALVANECFRCRIRTLTLFIRSSTPEDYRWMRMLWRWAYQYIVEHPFSSWPYEKVRLRVLLEERARTKR